jgi:hypothetical protein
LLAVIYDTVCMYVCTVLYFTVRSMYASPPSTHPACVSFHCCCMFSPGLAFPKRNLRTKFRFPTCAQQCQCQQTVVRHSCTYRIRVEEGVVRECARLGLFCLRYKYIDGRLISQVRQRHAEARVTNESSRSLALFLT